MIKIIERFEVWVRAKTEAGQGPPTTTVTARLEQRGDDNYKDKKTKRQKDRKTKRQKDGKTE